MSRRIINYAIGKTDDYSTFLAFARLMTGDVIEGLKVTQDSGSNTNVRVQAGTAGIPTGTYPLSYRYFVAVDTSGTGEVVAGVAPDASFPRNDLVVAYVDKAVTGITSVNDNVDLVFKLKVVAGTPGASPADPNNAAIQTAIGGASNPYIILARIRMAISSVTPQITNSQIDDLRSLAIPATWSKNPLFAAQAADGAWTDLYPTVSASIVGWTGTLTEQVVRYRVIGRTVQLMYSLAGTSNSANVSLNVPSYLTPAKLPVVTGSTTYTNVEAATGLAINNGAVDSSPGRVFFDMNVDPTKLIITRTGGAVSWTASGSKTVRGAITYEI